MDVIDRTHHAEEFVVAVQPATKDRFVFLSRFKVGDHMLMCGTLTDAHRFSDKADAIRVAEKFKASWSVAAECSVMVMLSEEEAERFLRAIETHGIMTQ